MTGIQRYKEEINMAYDISKDDELEIARFYAKHNLTPLPDSFLKEMNQLGYYMEKGGSTYVRTNPEVLLWMFLDKNNTSIDIVITTKGEMTSTKADDEWVYIRYTDKELYTLDKYGIKLLPRYIKKTGQNITDWYPEV